MINLLLSILFSLNASATKCTKPIFYLVQNEKAPCTGYLFSPELELEVRQDLLEFDIVKKQLDLKLSEVDILDEQVNKQKELISTLNKRIENNQNLNIYNKLLYFTLGVVLTSTIVYVSR